MCNFQFQVRFSSRCIPINCVDFSVQSLPIRFPICMEYSERFCFICLGLSTIYLVLTGFNDKGFEQTIHINPLCDGLHYDGVHRDLSGMSSANDKMAPSQELFISLTYSKGPNVEPCGTPIVIGTMFECSCNVLYHSSSF